MKNLYVKWWREQDGGGVCKGAEEKKDAEALGIDNVGGVFVMLVGGLIVSLFVGLLEFFFYAVRHPRKDKVYPGST